MTCYLSMSMFSEKYCLPGAGFFFLKLNFNVVLGVNELSPADTGQERSVAGDGIYTVNDIGTLWTYPSFVSLCICILVYYL